MSIVGWAEEVARGFLVEALPRRWAHVAIVAERASLLAAALGELDGDALQIAAWVHDIGYSPELAHTKFHPLDGARYLRGIGVPSRLAGLVAHHSSAASEAMFLGLDGQIREFDDEHTIVRDLLWYADMTVGPDGEHVTFERRMEEVQDRYAVDHYVVLALEAGMGERRAAVERAERWIECVGLANQV